MRRNDTPREVSAAGGGSGEAAALRVDGPFREGAYLRAVRAERPLHRHLGRRGVFLQLYLVIAAFSLLSVLGGGLFYSRSARNRLTSLYIQSNRAMLAQSVGAVSLIIDGILDSTNQVNGDSIIKGLLAQGGSSDPLRRQAVLARLAEIRYGGKYVRSLSVYLQRSGQVYDTDYGFCSIETFPDHTWLEPYRASERQITLVNQRSMRTSIHDERPPETVISLVSRLPTGGPRNEGALIVNIDPATIYEDVISRMGLGRGNDLVVLGARGEMILGQRDALPLVLSAFREERDAARDTTVVRREGGRAWLLTRTSSPLLGWDFVWVKSYDEVRALIASMQGATVLASMLLLATILLLGVLTARLTSRPMDELIDSLREQLSHSGIAAFRDIDRYVRGIAQKNVLLADRLGQMLPVYRERFLHRLLTDSSLGEDEIGRRFAELGIELEGRAVRVLAMEVLNLYELEEAGFRLPVLKLSLSGLVERILEGRRYSAYIVDADDAGLDVIVTDHRDDPDSVASVELARQLADGAREYLGVELAVGVSRRAARPSDLPGLYNESLAALSRRPVTGRTAVVSSEDARRGSPARPSALECGWEPLEKAVSAGRDDAAQEALGEVLDRTLREQRACGRDLEDFVIRLYVMISGYAGSGRLPDEVTHGEPVLEVLAGLKTLDGAEVFFRRLIACVCGRRRKAAEDADGEFLRRVMEYVDANFDNPLLCMDRLAADLHLSPSRIYRVLKERMGRTFVELLTQRRIDSACRLLLRNAKVKDVARQVGYGSAKYFIRVFKKVKGATPHRYRKIVA